MEVDIPKCRSCFNDGNEMHHLFSEFDQGLTLQEIFTSTTKFEISIDDGLPPYLCSNCTTIIVDFYNLKEIYQENEKHMVGLLSKNDDDSIEIDDNEDHYQDTIVVPKEDYITIKVESNCSDDEKNKDDLVLIKQERLSANQEDEYQEINTFTCQECGDCFLCKKSLQEHLLLKHDVANAALEELNVTALFKVHVVDQSVYKCKFCGKCFDSSEGYKEHLNSHKKNICDICGLGFVKKSYLRDHQEVHCKERRHVCNYCNKAFKRRTVLVKHRRIHTNPRECVCEICGKAFNDKGTLKTHIMLLHLKERNFMCMLCGMKFPLKATLEKHIKRHQNKERLFVCSQCPLGYKDKSSLDRHIFVKHSNQNIKVACKDCGREYTTTSNLLKHQRSCHAFMKKSPTD